ncbi:hypothetical protein EB796_009036 [Bugula neritina]|uniref:DH domain-containing protein n=1 Tax=Bugula neritina TaxID=10212 RepID=A0A7J7K3C9_BUGNE|nr:hypothetical protein EB796_009036 [Bugula neritina]
MFGLKCYIALFWQIAKELVLESYSEFINNYMKSNKLIKESLKERNGLEGFIRQQMKKSKELIGPKDQMIKVVQRFPQYILQIKDLIKHTPPDHDDYMKLNIALSKLENVAYQLNEKKRASEEKLAAEVILTKLWGSKHVTESVLLRQDDVVEMVYNSNGKLVYQKGRRLLLFNDMVCLIKIENSGADEKITSKWKCPMKHVEYKENAADSMLRSRVTGNTGTLLIQSGSTQRLGSEIEAVNETAAIVHKELEDLTHDQLLLTKIMSLTSSLTQEYEGLNSDVLAKHLKNVQTSIRLADEQLQMLDSCLISLSYLKNNQRVQTLFHMASPAIKQDWVMDFRAVKLAQNVINHHCWITEEPKRHYPLVVRNVDMNVTSQHTQVTCATPIFLTHSSGGIGLQYLWVCSNNDEHGQVTLLSIHANQPHIIESFEACEGVIDSCLLVPSHIHSALDQLWMSDCKNSVYVHGLRDTEWRSYSRKFSVPARVKVMCCHGEFVYLGLFNGSVLKYSKKKCSSLFMEPQSQQLVEHDEPVSCLLLLEQNKILAACGSTLFILSAIQELKILASVK